MDEDLKYDINDAIAILSEVCRMYKQECQNCPLFDNVCRGAENDFAHIPVNWEEIE